MNESSIRRQIIAEGTHAECLRSMLPCSWECSISRIFAERRRVYHADDALSGPDYDRQQRRAECGYAD